MTALRVLDLLRPEDPDKAEEGGGEGSQQVEDDDRLTNVLDGWNIICSDTSQVPSLKLTLVDVLRLAELVVEEVDEGGEEDQGPGDSEPERDVERRGALLLNIVQELRRVSDRARDREVGDGARVTAALERDSSHHQHGHPQREGEEDAEEDPHVAGPGLHQIVEECPEWTGADSHPGAAEEHHEEERSQDVNPEVDDHHHGEDVDGSLAAVGVHLGDPGRACDEPTDLEEEIDCKYWNER